MLINDIRSKFIEYFSKYNDHLHINSSSLLPLNDPSLMFVNSGMVQFKNIFTGVEKVDYDKAVTAQKCVRAGGKHNDLDNVGYTARHHTFFEMLGNFSFGDYFKEEAIFYSWELLTKLFGLDKDRLYVTVFHTDKEAIKLWKSISGLPEERIIEITTNDNFWSMGETGPCGPCSEIFYDHGDHIKGGLPGTEDSEGDRFIEIWNMVFMQFEQIDKNTRIDLPKRSIDTGMGLERIAAVLQNVHDNYEIDIFRNLISAIEDLTSVKSIGDHKFAHRIIADHLRSSAFLIADGIMPSNEGRGYVLRRIMRRAMRQVHQLQYNDLLMYKLVPQLIAEIGDVYNELKLRESLITSVIKSEEERFKSTLSKGLKLLEEETKNLSPRGVMSGSVAFKLYDTYGFPLDLTEDILKNQNIKVNHNEFNICMRQQQEKARQAWSGSGETKVQKIWFDLKTEYGATEFLGYQAHATEAKIIALIKSDQLVSSINDRSKFLLVANQTTFYAESGGQMGDIGYIENSKCKIKVIDTVKYLGSIHAHICELEHGSVSLNDIAKFTIDTLYRSQLQAHHSATHILHAVTREILGDHVAQKGSLVAYDKLRFDISHPKTITNEELVMIEKRVNQIIIENSEVRVITMPTHEAISNGAMALFGEKYDNEVRVVSMGKQPDLLSLVTQEVDNVTLNLHYSIELCGGTHVKRTGDIGSFKIISESAIAAGVRRIEAVVGLLAVQASRDDSNLISNSLNLLQASKAELLMKITNLINDKIDLEKEVSKLRSAQLTLTESQILSLANFVGGLRVVIKLEKGYSATDIRNAVQDTLNRLKRLVLVIINNQNNKLTITVGVSDDVINYIQANQLVKIISEYLGGKGGGGNSKIAQAGGGNDLSKLSKLERYIVQYIDEQKFVIPSL